jgi:hypothetical protein
MVVSIIAGSRRGIKRNEEIPRLSFPGFKTIQIILKFTKEIAVSG